MAAKIPNYKWILLSLFLGNAISWKIKEEITLLLLGKNFDARSELVQIGILISLTVLSSFIILCLMAIFGSFFLQKIDLVYRNIKPVKGIPKRIFSGIIEKIGLKRVIQFLYYTFLLCINLAACILINNQSNSDKITPFFGVLLIITIVLLYLGDRYLFELEVSSNKEHLIKDAILISSTIWIIYIWSHNHNILFALLPVITLIGRKFIHVSWKRIIYSLLVIQIFAAVAGFPQSTLLNLMFFRNGPESNYFHVKLLDGKFQTILPIAETGEIPPQNYDASNNIWVSHPEYFQNQTIQSNEDLCNLKNFCRYVFRKFSMKQDDTKDYSISEEERSKYLSKEGFYVPTQKGGWYLITENWSSDGVIEYYNYSDGENIEFFFVPTIMKGNTTYPHQQNGSVSNFADVIFVFLLTISGLLLSLFFKDKVPFRVFGLSSFLWGSALWIVVVFACFVSNILIKLWALPIFIIINIGLGIGLGKERIVLSEGVIKTLVFSILINCGLAFVFQYFNPVLFTFDSWYYYQKIAYLLVNDQFGRGVELLNLVGFSINGLQTGAPLFGKYYLPSVIPLLFVNLIIFINLAVLTNFKHNSPMKRYILPVALVNLSFIALPIVMAFNFYLHTNLITGIYLCAAVTCFTLYRYDNNIFDISALSIFGGLSFFIFMVSRFENGLFGVVIGLFILLKTRFVSKNISVISILTSLLIIIYIIKLLGYNAKGTHEMESYLVLFFHSMLILVNLIFGIFKKTFPLTDKIFDNFPRIFFITAFILVGVFLFIIDFERVIINLQAFILNGHIEGSFGVFWTLGIACVVILIFVQGDKLKWTNLFIIIICSVEILYFLLFTNKKPYIYSPTLFGSPSRAVMHYMFLFLPYLLMNYLALIQSKYEPCGLNQPENIN
jgi:hypothetical protein